MQNEMAFNRLSIKPLGSQCKGLNEERDHLELIRVIAGDLNTVTLK